MPPALPSAVGADDSSPPPNLDPLTNRLVRWFFLILPTLAVLGPVASYPLYSGGITMPYRLAYLPAVIMLFFIWSLNGQERIVGSRMLVVFLGGVLVFGTLLLTNAFSSKGASDHALLITGLLMAWLIAGAVVSLVSLRRTLLAGWVLSYFVVAVLTALNVIGLFNPPSPANERNQIYTSLGLQSLGFTGPLSNPNDLGAFAVAALPLVLLAAVKWSRPALALLAVIAAFGMVLVSQSRTAFIALVVTAITYVLLRRARDVGRLPVNLIVVGFISLTLIAFWSTGFGREFIEGLPFVGVIVSEFGQGVTAGDQARFSTWGALIEYSQWFGNGPGQFEVLTSDLYFALQSNAHNAFLEVLFEYGFLVGFVGAVWVAVIVVQTLRIASQATSDEVSQLVATGGAVLVGLIFWALVSSSLISTSSGWGPLLGTALGLVSLGSLSRSRTDPAALQGEVVDANRAGA